MIKIGILTFHAVHNFGANLQTLSTFNYLKSKRYEPIVIDFFPKLLEESFVKSTPSEQAVAHQEFVKKNLKLSWRCEDSAQVANVIRKLDLKAVIIGSDAVVQHHPLLTRIRVYPSRKQLLKIIIESARYEQTFPNPFWGDFVNYLDRQIPVVMMSVSCQNTDYFFIRGNIKKSMLNAIQKLRFISVRDKRTCDFFRFISNRRYSPRITPDPVFAFNQNVQNLPSKELIVRKYNLPDKYLLLSFHNSKMVDRKWLASFQERANLDGYSCVALTMPKGILFSNDLEYKIYLPLDPIDWYCLIKYSSGYIGANMHPLIVALHNNVPCFSFDHYGIQRLKVLNMQKTSKIYHLLEMAQLISNRISTQSTNYRPPVPMQVMDKIEAFDREKCSIFSEHMLNEYNRMMTDLLSAIARPDSSKIPID